MNTQAIQTQRKLCLRGATLSSATILLVGLGLAGPVRATNVPLDAFVAIESDFDSPNVIVADVDGDGDLDLVAASRGDDEVAWWENTAGDASAWARHDLDLAFNNVRGLVAGDLDGDGDTDIAAAAFNAGAVRWYENDPSGLVCGSDFCVATVASAFGFNDLAVADLDRDGDLDLVASRTSSDQVLWLENTTGDASSWSASTIAPGLDGAGEVAVGDLDGDGDLDVLGEARNGGTNGFAWSENNLDGAGACPSDWCSTTLDAGQGRGMAIADVDGDGDLDLLWSEAGVGASWWENTVGDGSAFTKHAITAGSTDTQKITPADLDADGDLDLFFGGGAPFWVENTVGDASVWTERTLPPIGAGTTLVVADLDGDGDGDGVVASGGSDVVGWFENQTLHRSTRFASGIDVGGGLVGASKVVGEDLDGDGDQDIVVSGFSEDVVRWSENDGTGAGWTDHTIISGIGGPFGLDTADLDGDGDEDVVIAAFSADDVVWIENDGAMTDGSWIVRTIDDSFNGAIQVDTADLDGDGDLDVLASGRFEDAVRWYENDGVPGDGGWTQHTLSDSGLDFPIGVRAGDIDGDGDLDVVAAAASSEAIRWFENDGSPADGGWIQRTVASGFDGALDAQPCDIDGDGDLDVVASARDDDQLAFFENDGTPTDDEWTKYLIVSDFVSARSVACQDQDGDGDLDVVASSGSSEGAVAIFLNDGNPVDGGWLRVDVETGLGSSSQAIVADLDNDGQLDVAASSSGGGLMRGWRNVGGQFALPTIDAVERPIPNEGDLDVALLRIDGAHRGRTGDGDAELATLELLFEAAADDPLADTELDALVDTLRLYLDDGDGVFDDAMDTMFFSVAPPFTLIDGVLTMTMIDEDPNVQMAFGSDVTWWLAADLDAGSGAAVPDTFRVTHVTSASSTAEMTETDLPLVLEGQDDVASSTLSINAGPRVDMPIDDQTILEGPPIQINVAPAFSEPEGEVLEFEAIGLPSGLEITSDGEILGFADEVAQMGSPYEVTVIASEPSELTAEDTFMLFIDGIPDVVTPLDDATVNEDASLNLDVSASFVDPDGDALTFEATGLPTTLTLSSDGVVTGTPLDSDLAGSPYTVTVTAIDPNDLKVSDTFALAINGRPDVVAGIDDATVAVGVAVSLDVAASFDDPEGDTLSFTAMGLPASLAMSSEGVMTGTPVIDDVAGSPYTVTVMAADPFDAAIDDTFTLVVSPDIFVDGFESGDTSAWTTSVP